MQPVPFLEMGEERNGEGGLRTNGYFKYSYKDTPLVSIITVVYNGEKYLEETILSVLNQNYNNVEYIIIDGGSTDETLDVIKKYEDKIDYWVSEKDSGMYDGIMKGFSVARGDVFSWINADDKYLSYTASVVAETFNNNPSIKWVTGIPSLMDERSNTYYVSFPKYYFQKFIKFGFYKRGYLGWLQQESMFWRKELYLKVINDGFNMKEYKLAADYCLWTKFAEYSSLYTIQTVLASFRVHENRQNIEQFLKKYHTECNRCKKEYYVIKLIFKIIRRPITILGIVVQLFNKLIKK